MTYVTAKRAPYGVHYIALFIKGVHVADFPAPFTGHKLYTLNHYLKLCK